MAKEKGEPAEKKGPPKGKPEKAPKADKGIARETGRWGDSPQGAYDGKSAGGQVQKGSPPGSRQEVGPDEPDEPAEADENQRQHGRRQGVARQEPHAAGGRHLAKITGQKPQMTKARVAVSGFRLRENNEIGCRVTLRGHRMYEFLDRLISVALPRIRDFRGINPKSFDGHGNYSIGLTRAVGIPGNRSGQGDVRAGHGHHHSSRARTTTTRRANCCGLSACRSGMPRRSLWAMPRPQRSEGRYTNRNRSGADGRTDRGREKAHGHRSEERSSSRSSWRSWRPAASRIRQGQDAAARIDSRFGCGCKLRPAAGGVSQVRHLPHLFPDMASDGLIPGVRKASW